MKPPKLFISHSSKDKDFVRQLAKDLADVGFSIWSDEWESSVGDSFAVSISNAIKDADFLLVVMSPDYFSSGWATQEWQVAMLEEMEERRIKIIPLMYRSCEAPKLLRDKLWIDFRNSQNYTNSLNVLITGLGRLQDTGSTPKRTGGSPEIGQRIRSINNSEISTLTKVLQEAVEAFKSGSDSHSAIETQTDLSQVEEGLCFVIMPFGVSELNIVYEDFVKPTLEDSCGLRCERGDDVFGSNVIVDDIRKSIVKAQLIVADLTGRNANVFYEVGIAHTLNKVVLLLAQSIDDVPFDLRHRRVLLYEYSPRGCKKLEKDLKGNVYAVLQNEC